MGFNRLFIGIFICLIFASSFLSALDSQINPEFKQGETLLAKVSGNFLDIITPQNVSLYQDNERVSFVAYVKKIRGDFYIYGQTLGKPEGNYSLKIQGVRYYSSGNVLSSEDIVLNFKITNQTADFSVEPLILESNQDFSVKIKNLNLDKKINVTSVFGRTQKTILFDYGETKEIKFSSLELIQGWNTLNLSSESISYQVNVYSSEGRIITPPQPDTSNLTPGAVLCSESEIAVRISESDSELSYSFQAINPWDYRINSVKINISEDLQEYVKVINESFSMNADSSEYVSLSFYFSGDLQDYPQEIKGELFIETPKAKTVIPVKIVLSEEDNIQNPENPETNPPEEDDPKNSGDRETCIGKGDPQYSGEFCLKDEICEGVLVFAVNSSSEGETKCCIGTCKVKVNVDNEKESSSKKANKIVGWVLVIFLIGFVAWFILKKYKGAVRPIDLLKIGKGKTASKSSTGKLDNAEKIGLEREFEENDLPSEIKNALDFSQKKKDKTK